MFHERQSELSANLLQQFQCIYLNDFQPADGAKRVLARGTIFLMAHTISSVITPYFATPSLHFAKLIYNWFLSLAKAIWVDEWERRRMKNIISANEREVHVCTLGTFARHCDFLPLPERESAKIHHREWNCVIIPLLLSFPIAKSSRCS
jgi:hypothetical protein